MIASNRLQRTVTEPTYPEASSAGGKADDATTMLAHPLASLLGIGGAAAVHHSVGRDDGILLMFGTALLFSAIALCQRFRVRAVTRSGKLAPDGLFASLRAEVQREALSVNGNTQTPPARATADRRLFV